MVTTGHQNRVVIDDIEGGEAPVRIDMDAKLTADNLYDTYRRYPGYRDILELESDAIWSNWLSEDIIEMDRLIECKDGMTDAIGYGFAVIIVDATLGTPKVERWHTKIKGTGFSVIETSKMGFPLKIQVQARFNESTAPINYEVDHYPCDTQELKIGMDGETPVTSVEYIRDKPLKGGRGFFLIRTRGGRKGIRGLPQYLHLIMPIRKAYDIIENYATYAENQALGHLVFGLDKNDKANRQSIKDQYQNQTTHRKMSIIGANDWAAWTSPMNSSWDPWAMLEYIDKLIARATQMNKLMLEGDPGGHLSASETAIGNWESKTKEKQSYWLGQFKPIFMALGASKDITFRDPSKPTFSSLMDGLKSCREALINIVTNEDIVELFNEYLAKHGMKNKLTPISNEEMNKTMGGEESNGDSESANSSGNETSKEGK